MQTVRTINKRFWRQAAVAAGIAVVPFTLGTAILVTPDAARADVQTYSDSKRVYKVGLLMIDSTADADLDGTISPAEALRGPENPDPFVFYVADQRTDIKPNGWVLENPLAPSTVTTDILQRWTARDPGHPYKIGQTVTKDMAAYWEVSLTKATEAELLQYDLLFITNHRRTRFSPADREKLRKVVDAGGVVWMDDCGGMTIDPNGRFFLEEVQFNSGTGSAANAGPSIVQPAHPLLNSPYPLSYDDILRLGDKAYRNYYMVTMPVGQTTTVPTAPNKETLSTIIGNTAAMDNGNALPYVTAGIYGSGAVILTSADVGCGVNDYVGGVNAGSGGNSGAYSGNNLIAANIEDLKITYNAIAWGGANNTVRRNNRRTAASFSATAAPLNPSFDFRNTLFNAVVSSSSPIISQGIMYVAGIDNNGNYTLRAYDTVPGRDYDNDGNYDDGIQDLLRGTPYDEIWRWQGGAANGLQPSSPVLATLNDANGKPRDVIMVTLGDGTVEVFNARPIDAATGRLSPAAQVLGTNGPSATGGTYTAVANTVAPAPVYFGNKIYVVEPTRGIVRCIDASTLTTTWTSTVTNTATSNPSNATYAVTATPTLGLNRLVVNKTRDTNRPSQENTIAANTNETTNDVMLYVPTADANASNSKVLAYWLGARNEGTKDIRSESGTTYVRFRPANGNQVFISPGGNGFITPTIQIFADVDLPDGRHFSREENFAAGRPVFPMDPFFTANGYGGGAWTATWQNSTVNGGYYSGRVVVTRNGSALDTNTERILAVASYDVVYNPGDGSTPPTDLATTPGHRNAGPMTLPSAVGLDTVAFAPNDLLIYTANVTGTSGTPAGPWGVINAMQEREFSLNASRLRWRYLLHEGSTQTINNISVTDLPALRNRAIFNTSDPNAPLGLTRLISDAAVNNGAFYESLTNVNTIGSPITTNDGVTYVLARARSGQNQAFDPGNPQGIMTVLMAFQTVPQITLELGEPIQNNTTVTLSQYDQLNGTTVSTNGDPNDRTRVDVDYRTGRITVADFGALNNGNNMLSASSAFVVTYTKSAGNTGGATAAPVSKVIYPFGTLPAVSTADDLGNVLQAATGTSSGGYSPLLWYYVLPGVPQSSPTMIGSQLFFNTVINNKSWVMALDADPASNDPTVRVRSGEQVYGVTDQIAYGTAAPRDVNRNHVRWMGSLSGDVAAIGLGSPTGGEGVLAINTVAGTNAFSEGLTLLADQTRVMEVNADGAPVWSADGTAEIQTSGGAPPIYNGNGGLETPNNTRGRQTLNAKSFSSPQTVRRLGSSDYLVADTGNNRIVRFDRSGKVQWNLERINDPLGILAPGDPRTLNTPTDVLTRTLSTFDTGGNRIGYEVHYIIADSGNHRVIDVVDYYDLNGRVRTFNIDGQAGVGDTDTTTHVVVWTSKTKSTDNNLFEYHNLQLSAELDPATNTYGKPVLVASVSNSNVAAANNTATSSTAGGSVVRLDYNPRNTGFIMVNAAGAATGVTYYWGGGFDTGLNAPTNTVAEPASNGRVQLAINELRFVTNQPFTKRLRNPSYFERIPMSFNGLATTVPVYLIADAGGIYLCTINTTATPGESVFDVIWAFGQEQYNTMNTGRMFNPIGTAAALPAFSPSSVKRLANGHFLITNSAVGASKIFESGQFLGEVFEVIPAAFDVTASATGVAVNSTQLGGTYAKFSAPFIKAGSAGNGATGRILNKQQMGRDRNGGTLTEQPRSADRL